MALFDDIAAPYALIQSPVRSIGGIIPDCVIEEIHSHDLAVTDHPVEEGAAISDHAFLLPSRLQMRIGFSNSTAGAEGYVQAMLEDLKRLQASREPFTVYTGKEVLRQQLMGRIAFETTAATEHALMVTVELREILITYTSMTSGSSATNKANPEDTKSTTNNGTLQAGEYTSNYDTSSNTGFLKPDSDLGISAPGGSYGTGDLYVDGVGVIPNTGITTEYGGGSYGSGPLGPGANYGPTGGATMFGGYGPGAFTPRANSPF